MPLPVLPLELCPSPNVRGTPPTLKFSLSPVTVTLPATTPGIGDGPPLILISPSLVKLSTLISRVLKESGPVLRGPLILVGSNVASPAEATLTRFTLPAGASKNPCVLPTPTSILPPTSDNVRPVGTCRALF